MPEYVLYNAPQSTCSQRVRFSLNAKGVPFEQHKLDLFSGDQLKPDYLAINPNGLVPTLLVDGTPVVDSSVILEFLDETAGETVSFTPDDPLERAAMRTIIRYIDEVPTPAIRIPSYNLAFLPHFQAMEEDEFLEMANSKPLRKEFLLKMGRTGFSDADMNEALDRLQRGITRMNDTLQKSGGPWLLGSELTLADISIMPVIVRMDDINLHGYWDDKPAIAEWLDKIRDHSAFKPTYYHGSLLTEKYPHLSALRAER